MDLTKARVNRFLQINELDEMRLDAYESSISDKERIKRWHDKWIKTPINHEKGDKILLFNSRLSLFPKKLKSRWYGPFSVSKDVKNGAIELYDEDGNEFIKRLARDLFIKIFGTNGCPLPSVQSLKSVKSRNQSHFTIRENPLYPFQSLSSKAQLKNKMVGTSGLNESEVLKGVPIQLRK
ncbi:hypothetical protein Tco_1286346, partial [Tanacetum coccineum]